MTVHSGKRLLLSLYLPAAILAFCSGLSLPIMPVYVRSFDTSYGLIGAVLAAQGLGTLACDVPAGLLVRKFGYKKVMLLGAVCIVTGFLALFWAGTLAEVVFYRLISGAGMALWGIARHAYIAEIIKVGSRGRSIAMLGGIGRIGIFLGPALGGALGKVYGLRAPFLLCAVLGTMALAATAIWIADDPKTRVKQGAAATVHSFWEIVGRHYRVLLTAGSGQLFAQMIRASRHIIIPLYATDIIGLDVQSVGLIISIASGLDVLMFYPAGVIMDRQGRKYAYVPSFAIQAAGMLAIPMAGSFAALLAAAGIIGLGNGIGSGTMMTLGADLAPEKERGEFLGLWRFIGDVGHAGSPLVIGGIAELLGLVTTPLVTAAVGILGASILGFLVPETLRKGS